VLSRFEMLGQYLPVRTTLCQSQGYYDMGCERVSDTVSVSSVVENAAMHADVSGADEAEGFS
jgi:hypothetical protein